MVEIVSELAHLFAIIVLQQFLIDYTDVTSNTMIEMLILISIAIIVGTNLVIMIYEKIKDTLRKRELAKLERIMLENEAKAREERAKILFTTKKKKKKGGKKKKRKNLKGKKGKRKYGRKKLKKRGLGISGSSFDQSTIQTSQI